MRRILTISIISSTIILYAACKRDFVEITGLDRANLLNDKKIVNPSDSGVPQISSINLVNNTLTISGANLNSTSVVRITGPDSFDHTFNISSSSSSEIIAFASANISLVSNAVFSVLVTNSFGEAIQTITLEIPQNSAEIGQILRWNGSGWTLGDLGALTYSGNWNATANTPDLLAGGSSGEYYIVTTAGTTDLSGGIGTDTWNVGDWAIWNQTQAQWEKISNGTNVQSFNGRSGAVFPLTNDYTWAQIDKTTAYINDLADVVSPSPSNDDILKWNGTSWSLASDETSGGANSINSVNITDGTIVNTDINASAAIAQSKISGLPSVVTQVSTNQTDITNKTTRPGSACNGTNKLQWNGSAFTCVADSNAVTNVTGTAPVVSSGGSTPIISMLSANGTRNGYLSNTDWQIFNGKQSSLNFGISDNFVLEIDSNDVADNDYAKFTANGLEGRNPAEVKVDLGLNNVDNTTDAAKPVSTAQQTAIDGKVTKIASTDNAIARYNGTTGEVKNSSIIVEDGDSGRVFNASSSIVKTVPGAMYFNTSWANIDTTNFKVDLPSAGTYLVYGSFRALHMGSVYTIAKIRLYNNTALGVYPSSTRMLIETQSVSHGIVNMLNSSIWRVVVTEPTTFYLQGIATELNIAGIQCDANGWNEFGYIRAQ